MKYFSTAWTVEEIKSEYRKLCKIFHPDVSGFDSSETMKEINTEYKKAIAQAHTNTGKTQSEVKEEMEFEAEFMEKIQALVSLEGIIIEIVGRWLWVSGKTYENKEYIKSVGFLFASHKKMWFWRPDDAKTYKNKKEMAIEDIRAKYGSKIVNPRQFNFLNN
jgi:hypothetical protein